jgi:hypothetical protein
MFKELKKLLMPRKLWILRLYIALLTFIVEFLLGAYVLISIYNLITSDNALGDLVLGYAGLYLVWVCLAILFVIQIVYLFLNIHDNIEDVRNKAINPDFAVDLKEEKEKSTEASLSSIGTITIIVLSIILSFVNLNRQNDELSKREKILSFDGIYPKLERENDELSKGEKTLSFDEIYPKLEKAFLIPDFCDPPVVIKKVKNGEATVLSKSGRWLCTYTWNPEGIKVSDIDGDGLNDYTIEVFSAGGVCGGNQEDSCKYTLFSTKSDRFLRTHVKADPPSNEWIELGVDFQ